MATTLAAQLQAIRNIAQLDAEPQKRPFTRPFILFDPKETADLDLDTLLSFALSGPEALATLDNRFGGYKVTLFSHKSRDVDRELMGLEENKSLNASISSHLRLPAGFLNMHSALKTLEYFLEDTSIKDEDSRVQYGGTCSLCLALPRHNDIYPYCTVAATEWEMGVFRRCQEFWSLSPEEACSAAVH